MLRRYCMIVPLLLAVVGPAFAAESDVKAELFADTGAVEAGKPFQVAVRLTPHRGWHVYWRNPGEAGLPTKITWHLPPGFVAGPVAYPIPEKLIAPGGIINYGYEGAATFVATITPPADVPSKQPVAIEAAVSWLSCRDVCVPGRASLDLSLPAGRATPAHAELFTAAQEALPANTAPASVESFKVEPPDGDHLEAAVAWKEDVDKVEVFPLPAENLEVSHIKVTTASRGSTISLDARLLAGQGAKPATLPVLITFTSRSGKRAGFYTDIPLAALSPGAAH